jgi:hypothetical protein
MDYQSGSKQPHSKSCRIYFSNAIDLFASLSFQFRRNRRSDDL